MSHKPRSGRATARTSNTGKAVIYARVSSKEQDREGFSIPAQLKLLAEFANNNDYTVVRQFVDVETAKVDGRTHFNEMITYLRKHPSVRTVLVEKTDRLYRNLKDWVTIDDLDVEIHLVKEGVSLSRDSRSSEKFMHGIKVLMAKNYIDNLSEEVRKGMLEKATQGLWPSAAPMGYLNVVASDGKRVIEVDPRYAQIIPKMFQWYATGNYNLREIGAMARRAGFMFRRTNAYVPHGTIARLFRNRIYIGEFEWLGKVYTGKHQPLIDKDLWHVVQDIMDGKLPQISPHARPISREFVFTGMIKCGHCECILTAEIKKEKYVYYHCTANKGKCPEKYVREEKLVQQFSAILQKLRFDTEVFDLLVAALKSSHSVERQEHAQSIARLSGEIARLVQRLDQVYLDKLDGRITEDHYNRLSNQWRDERRRCEDDINRYQEANDSYMDEGVALVGLALNAHRIFESEAHLSRRRLLNFILSNCTWKDGKLSAEFKQPFELLQESGQLVRSGKMQSGYNDAEKQNWLGN